MPEERAQSSRIITRITVAYRIPDDPTEHQFTIEHTGEGQDVDALTWSRPLLDKLAYREGTEYREPQKRAGRGEWKVTGGTTSASIQPDCVWIHHSACQWSEYCPDM